MLLGGCEPSCEQVCVKLVECEEPGTERMNATECEEQCLMQKETYAVWSDVQLRDAFDAELACIYDSACEDVTAGVCYDEEVYTF